MSVKSVNVFTVAGGSIPPAPGVGAINMLYDSATNSLRAINPDGTTRAVTSESYQAWTPALTGSTQAPSAITYSTQTGRYHKVGKMVSFSVNIITTNISKLTRTDELRVNLPFKCANVTGAVYNCAARVGNATAVLNGGLAQVAPNTQHLTFRATPLSGVTSAVITYEATSLGVISNTVTIQASGFYESVS